MITIQIPHISIQSVSNGYVVQWKDTKNAKDNHPKPITKTAIDRNQLTEILGDAFDAIETYEQTKA